MPKSPGSPILAIPAIPRAAARPRGDKATFGFTGSRTNICSSGVFGPCSPFHSASSSRSGQTPPHPQPTKPEDILIQTRAKRCWRLQSPAVPT